MPILVKQKKFAFLAITALCTVLVACDEDSADSSSDVDTSRTYVDMRVSGGDTDTVTAIVQLLNANPVPDNQIELRTGDALWFSYGQNISQLAHGDSDDLFDSFNELSQTITQLRGGQEVRHFLWLYWLHGDTWYSGTLNEADSEIYYVSYLRRDFADALNSYVTLPQRFTITAPLANEIVSRNNDIVVSWQPSNTSLMVAISAYIDCATGTSGLTDQHVFSVSSDSGSYTIAGGTLNSSAVSGSCATTLEISKSQLGTVDSALYGGSIIGERFSTTTIMTTN